MLLLPTAPDHPTVAEVAADPLGVNRRLGTLSRASRTFRSGRRRRSRRASWTARHSASRSLRARSPTAWPPTSRAGSPASRRQPVGQADPPAAAARDRRTPLRAAAEPRAHRARRAFVAPSPPRPLPAVRACDDPAEARPPARRAGRHSVEGEVWLLPPAGLGSLLARPAGADDARPRRLEDGTEVTGFFCQASATDGAADISVFGGWRGYLESRQ